MRSTKAKTVIGSFREERKLELNPNDSWELNKQKTELQIFCLIPYATSVCKNRLTGLEIGMNIKNSKCNRILGDTVVKFCILLSYFSYHI